MPISPVVFVLCVRCGNICYACLRSVRYVFVFVMTNKSVDVEYFVLLLICFYCFCKKYILLFLVYSFWINSYVKYLVFKHKTWRANRPYICNTTANKMQAYANKWKLECVLCGLAKRCNWDGLAILNCTTPLNPRWLFLYTKTCYTAVCCFARYNWQIVVGSWSHSI